MWKQPTGCSLLTLQGCHLQTSSSTDITCLNTKTLQGVNNFRFAACQFKASRKRQNLWQHRERNLYVIQHNPSQLDTRLSDDNVECPINNCLSTVLTPQGTQPWFQLTWPEVSMDLFDSSLPGLLLINFGGQAILYSIWQVSFFLLCFWWEGSSTFSDETTDLNLWMKLKWTGWAALMSGFSRSCSNICSFRGWQKLPTAPQLTPQQFTD